MPIPSFSPKTPTEKVILAFSFSGLGVLLPGETISAKAVSASVFSGTDATPSAILNGSPFVDPLDPARILQGVQNGVDGVVYKLCASITTSLGNVYEIYRLLRIDSM